MILLREKQALSRYRQQLREIQAARQTLEAGLMRPEPMVEGCLVKVLRVCGKAGCRCASSKKLRHGPYLNLSLLRQGKTRTIHIPEEWEEEVKAGVETARRYRKIHRQWRTLTKRMETIWRQVERCRKHLPYEPKKKSR